MRDPLVFVLQHGYLVLFALTLGEQMGLPLPSGTALLAAGALARSGRLSAPPVVALAVLAAVLGHGTWFFAGRMGGNAVLRFICKIAIEPDSCVRRTNGFFARHGSKSLLVAPFIPGFATVAPPLAGSSGMGLPRFLLLDGLGAALWAGTLVSAGYLLGPALGGLLVRAAAIGPLVLAGLGLLLAAWIALKLRQRRKLLDELDVPRITPGELQAMRARQEPHLLIDLREPEELAREPVGIPGAVRMRAGELAARLSALPRGQPIILYCS